MQLTENIAKFKKNSVLKHFPKGHVFLIAALFFALLISSLTPSPNATANHKYEEILLPALESDPVITDIATPTDHPSLIEQTEEPFKIIKQTVKSGDSLSAIFKRAGLNDKIMITLLNNCKQCKAFTKLYPKHYFEFSLNQKNDLIKLRYIKDRLNELKYSKTTDNYSFKEIHRQPDIKTAYREGTIKANLFESAKSAKLNDRLTMELANIFGWDIDFALDIRKGDSFKVVYEEHFLDGEKIQTGNILAAEFTNQGETFKALRYINNEGDTSYYTPEGKSMRKAFLRAPLDFRRISGNFNPKRVHPIFKTVRPHRGTDYAASRGTPIWSPGNGKVIASSYSKANGNYIVIQHGNSIQTKYLHLHKRLVKKGQKVKQKQTIGTVGSTGYSTGPHLHYEFLIAGVHRNPRTVINKLPKAASIKKSELPLFKTQTSPWLAELNPLNSNEQYASKNTDNTPL